MSERRRFRDGLIGFLLAVMLFAGVSVWAEIQSRMPALSADQLEVRRVLHVAGFREIEEHDLTAERDRLAAELGVYRRELVRLRAVLEARVEPEAVLITRTHLVPAERTDPPGGTPHPSSPPPDPGETVSLSGASRVEIVAVGDEQMARAWWSCQADGDGWSASRGPVLADTVRFAREEPETPLWPAWEAGVALNTSRGVDADLARCGRRGWLRRACLVAGVSTGAVVASGAVDKRYPYSETVRDTRASLGARVRW